VRCCRQILGSSTPFNVLLARDAQAKLALIVAQCLSIHLSICVHLSVRDSLSHAYVGSIARREPRRLPACNSIKLSYDFYHSVDPLPLSWSSRQTKVDGTRPKFSAQVSGTRNWLPETCVQVAHTSHAFWYQKNLVPECMTKLLVPVSGTRELGSCAMGLRLRPGRGQMLKANADADDIFFRGGGQNHCFFTMFSLVNGAVIGMPESSNSSEYSSTRHSPTQYSVNACVCMFVCVSTRQVAVRLASVCG